jgi:hypothetical protein
MQSKSTINVSFVLDYLLFLSLRYGHFFGLGRRQNHFRDFLRSFLNNGLGYGSFSTSCGFYGSDYLFDNLSFFLGGSLFDWADCGDFDVRSSFCFFNDLFILSDNFVSNESLEVFGLDLLFNHWLSDFLFLNLNHLLSRKLGRLLLERGCAIVGRL